MNPESEDYQQGYQDGYAQGFKDAVKIETEKQKPNFGAWPREDDEKETED